MALRSLVPATAAVLWLLAALGAPASADLYRWTDESGRLHFTSDPSKVPARYRDQAAQPLEDAKSTLNRVPSRGQAPAVRRGRVPTGHAPARRMDAFAEKKPPSPKPTPQKYRRDCNNSHNTGRCRSWVNPEWKDWKRDQDAKKTAPAQDEFDN